MTIGTFASKGGVPASTIRYWERIGVLPKAARKSGQRRYTDDSIHHLAVLRLAQACGFRLDEMRHLMRGFASGTAPASRWKALAQKKRTEIDDWIAQLKAMRHVVDKVLACQCAALPDCGRLAASAIKVETPPSAPSR